MSAKEQPYLEAKGVIPALGDKSHEYQNSADAIANQAPARAGELWLGRLLDSNISGRVSKIRDIRRGPE